MGGFLWRRSSGTEGREDPGSKNNVFPQQVCFPLLSSWWLHFFFEHASRVFLCVSWSAHVCFFVIVLFLFLFLSCFWFACVLLLLASAFVFARSGPFMLVPAPVLEIACFCLFLCALVVCVFEGWMCAFSLGSLAANLATPDWHMWEGLGRESLELPLRALKEEL